MSVVVNNGDKLAIIGEEGNGKSTLLKCILGKCDYAKISGTIDYKNKIIGYLPQTLEKNELKKTGYKFLFENDDDYYNKINEFYGYLKEINITDKILDQTLETYSGGEKVKIGILKLLLERADILILDEPTNDLDLDTLEWLEGFIIRQKRPVIYVSHDEVLLEKTANMILHLEQVKKKSEARHTIYSGDYKSYVEKRLNSLDKQEQLARNEKKEYEKKQKKLQQVMQKVEYQQNTISRSDPHGAKLLKKKMHSLKSQERKLDNLEITEVPDVEEKINFFFEMTTIPKMKKIIELKLEKLEVADKILCKNIEFEVLGNEHICIIGDNGCGKTTLIKKIVEELKDRDDLVVGYMPQDYDDILNKFEYVLDFICDTKVKDEITKARMYLGNMNFTKEEMEGKISDLSNGTKAKLLLTKLVLDKCNVLVLDEPTRNVSPLSNPVIRRVLNDFQGCIISVSHDRKYIEEVATKVYRLDHDGLNVIM